VLHNSFTNKYTNSTRTKFRERRHITSLDMGEKGFENDGVKNRYLKLWWGNTRIWSFAAV